MKGKFPKFLKQNPSVLGLGFIEILILIVGLFLSQLLHKNALFGLVITLSVLILYKTFLRYIDLEGILLGIHKKRSQEWILRKRDLL